MIFYSEFQQSFYLLPLVGLVIGVLATMMGSGGGFFFPVILILFFRVSPHIAVPTSLTAILPLCVVALLAHHREGNINFRLGLIFAVSGIVGAIAGAGITRLISTEQLRMIFGLYSIVLAIIIFSGNYKNQRRIRKGKEIKEITNTGEISLGSVYGFAGGIISGTFGTSGTAPVLTGLLAMRMPVKMVVGTSLMVVLVNTISALTSHIFIGEIDLTLVLLLTSGTIIGALIGPRLLSSVSLEKSEPFIKQAFALIILIFGIVLTITK
jgi:uncharacterized protein